MKLRIFLFFGIAVALVACSATNGSTGAENCPECDVKISSSFEKSSSSKESSSSEKMDSLFLNWQRVPEGTWLRAASNTKITQTAFFISRTEISQYDYEAVMNELPPEQMKTGDSLPVTNVSWFDAIRFANALSKRWGYDTAYVYSNANDVQIDYKAIAIRLPTEAEWEYAIRAGTTTEYYWKNSVDVMDYAVYSTSSGYSNIGTKLPNAWGLYDMAGNVAEWCADWYGDYPMAGSLVDPTGADKGNKRVVRGGSWDSSVAGLRSSTRNAYMSDFKSNTIGFRVVVWTAIREAAEGE